MKVFSNGAHQGQQAGHRGYPSRTNRADIRQNLPLRARTLAKLQEYIDRRSKTILPVTIKEEIDIFPAGVDWGRRNRMTRGVFPCAGLVYPKSYQLLPFVPWDKIKRRVKAGGDADTLWECLYLKADL